jgi:hypothetical protein
VRAAALASAVDLDRPGHYLHWWVIQISVANLVIIGLMVVVFALALVVPFPKPRQQDRVEKDRS